MSPPPDFDALCAAELKSLVLQLLEEVAQLRRTVAVQRDEIARSRAGRPDREAFRSMRVSMSGETTLACLPGMAFVSSSCRKDLRPEGRVTVRGAGRQAFEREKGHVAVGSAAGDRGEQFLCRLCRGPGGVRSRGLSDDRCQYSSVSITVRTRVVTDGSAGSGERDFISRS